MANMEFTESIGFGALGSCDVDINYRVGVAQGRVEIYAVWLYLDDNPHDVFNELTSDAQEHIQDLANRHWAEHQAEERICAEEAHADMLREERMMK